MNFFTRVAVLFYVTLVLFIGCAALLYAGHVIRFDSVLELFAGAYSDETMRLGVGAGALGLLFINFLFFRLFSVDERRERIIAFDNPSGRVSVALVALEDLIRRAVGRFPEVKESRAGIRASKRGLNVKIRLVLCSEVNIPEVTSQVQERVKRKIQDVIGLDEPVNVAVYVGKILPERVKEKSSGKRPEPEEKRETNVPFQGYRA